MTNIVMLSHNRERLTTQAIESLYASTSADSYSLVLVDDGSDEFYADNYGRVSHGGGGTIKASRVVRFCASIGIVGFLRNIGAMASERYFGRGEYLYFTDNDVYFWPGWLQKMTTALETIRTSEREDSKPFSIIGGYRHPFHGVNSISYGEPHTGLRIEETDAVAGYSHLMKWSTWDRYGPYDQHAKGVCQSEDFAICQKIIADRGHVGYLSPSVISNCGVTNSENKPAVGSESFPRVEGLIYE